MVLAVGSHTLKEKELREDMESNKYALQVEKEETPFQSKLRILSEIIGTYAYMILVVSLILYALTWLHFGAPGGARTSLGRFLVDFTIFVP